ncbi:MAG: recombinase family protein, partial [Clostridia bacterium]|nr:recombinase family protein [Clostridia bacterium]
RLKEIARRLNERERKTPAQLQYERYGKRRQDIHKAKDGSYVWTYTSVKNILTDESYVGVLTNHRKQMREGKTYAVPEAEQFRHEGVYPVIIQREDWGRVQELLNQNARKHPAPGNKARHRYAGLLACAECGNPFVPMIRYWRGNSRVEYVCKGYQRNGKTYCASHRIHEETLDARVWELVSTACESRAEELKKLAQMQKMWALRKPILDAHISALQKKVQELEREIDEIVIEKLKGSVSNPRPR